jgi:hypothetical protein
MTYYDLLAGWAYFVVNHPLLRQSWKLGSSMFTWKVEISGFIYGGAAIGTTKQAQEKQQHVF